jgi:hypothetical protein
MTAGGDLTGGCVSERWQSPSLWPAYFGRYRGVMPSPANDGRLSRFEELYASARQERRRAHQTVRRAEDILQDANAVWRVHQQACARARQLHQLSLSGQQDRLQYSATARLQARLASMPVIEQAKGILMAQCGWTPEEAFDALRRTSQRSNVRVRDLAAVIVAKTVRSAQPQSRQAMRAAAAQPSRAAVRSALAHLATVQVLPRQRRTLAGAGQAQARGQARAVGTAGNTSVQAG